MVAIGHLLVQQFLSLISKRNKNVPLILLAVLHLNISLFLQNMKHTGNSRTGQLHGITQSRNPDGADSLRLTADGKEHRQFPQRHAAHLLKQQIGLAHLYDQFFIIIRTDAAGRPAAVIILFLTFSVLIIISSLNLLRFLFR